MELASGWVFAVAPLAGPRTMWERYSVLAPGFLEGQLGTGTLFLDLEHRCL